MKTLLILMLVTLGSVNEADFPFESDSAIDCVEGTLNIQGDALLLHAGESRYLLYGVPKDLQIQDLKVAVSGMQGKVPPTMRLMGTPLNVQKLFVQDRSQRRQHDLDRKYVF